MAFKKNIRVSLLPFLSPSGLLIVLICFFIPWLEVKCSGKKIIGSGLTFAQEEAALWLIPIFALLGLIIFFWYKKGLSIKKYKIGSILSACLGLFMMIAIYISIEQKLNGFIIKRITNYQIKFGLIATIFGFLLTIFSTLFSKSKLEKNKASNSIIEGQGDL